MKMVSRAAAHVKSNPVCFGPRPFVQLWQLYFLLSIAVLGGALAYGICVPLWCASLFFPRLRPLSGRFMAFGIRILLRVQPWLAAETDIRIPTLQFRGGKGVLLVSNHRSHLDAFIVLAQVANVRILAKRALFFVPFLNLIMFLSRQIPVARGDARALMRAMDKVEQALRNGEVVHVFPEMTRCQLGFQGTMAFSAAPFQAAGRAGAVVVPVVIQGTDQAWPRDRFGLHYRTPIKVQSLEPVWPGEFSSALELRNEVKQRVDEALR